MVSLLKGVDVSGGDDLESFFVLLSSQVFFKDLFCNEVAGARNTVVLTEARLFLIDFLV